MPRFIKLLFILPLFIAANTSFASEPTYIGNQKFFPLQTQNVRTIPAKERTAENSPKKFFPLSASRFPAPIRNEAVRQEQKENVIDPQKSGKKEPMSQEQAKQILSIFAEAN